MCLVVLCADQTAVYTTVVALYMPQQSICWRCMCILKAEGVYIYLLLNLVQAQDYDFPSLGYFIHICTTANYQGTTVGSLPEHEASVIIMAAHIFSKTKNFTE